MVEWSGFSECALLGSCHFLYHCLNCELLTLISLCYCFFVLPQDEPRGRGDERDRGGDRERERSPRGGGGRGGRDYGGGRDDRGRRY
jgi:hypothetical protein